MRLFHKREISFIPITTDRLIQTSGIKIFVFRVLSGVGGLGLGLVFCFLNPYSSHFYLYLTASRARKFCLPQKKFCFGFLGLFLFCFKYISGFVSPEHLCLLRKVTKLRQLKKKAKAKATGHTQSL